MYCLLLAVCEAFVNCEYTYTEYVFMCVVIFHVMQIILKVQ